MKQMHREFEFTNAGRTFTCTEGPLRHRGVESWWWFVVSTEQHQRHAPFRAEATDTVDDVKARVVAYYDELLARRAAPPVNRWSRRPGAPAQGTPAPAADGAAGDDTLIDGAIAEGILGDAELANEVLAEAARADASPDA